MMEFPTLRNPEIVPAQLEGDPLFRSIHAALMFAFTYVPNQHARAAAAERLIDQFAKSRYEADAAAIVRVLSSPRGLTGLDGACQSGMILSAVRRLPYPERCVLHARFDFMRIPNQREALRGLAMLVAGRLQIEPERAQFVVQGCYGRANREAVMKDRETFLGVAESTAFKYLKIGRQMITEIEQRAFDSLEPGFKSGGVIV